MGDFQPNPNTAAPLADSHDVATTGDTIGNKADTAHATAATTSIVSLIRYIISVVGALADVASEAVGAATVVALLRAIIVRLGFIRAGGRVTTFPDAAGGAALLAGAANTYGALVNVSGALAADSIVTALDFDTPAVAVEPCQWELSYGAGANIVATGMIGFDTAVGTYPTINLVGQCGIIPTGATLQVRIRSASGATTALVHCSTMPAV